MTPKTIGIIGGMSPESTVEYYQYIVRRYVERNGDHSYPPIIIHSVSFQPYIDWPNAGEWEKVAEGLSTAAQSLEAAGVDFAVIATNTMHLVIDQVQAAVSIPILSLLDVIADAIEARGFKTVGLLGTRFTMEQTFYHEALGKRGIDVLTPEADDRSFVNQVIYEELVAGQFLDASRAGYVEIAGRLAQAGAQGIIAGCTEIPLLITEADVGMPLFNTTTLHAEAALMYATSDTVIG